MRGAVVNMDLAPVGVGLPSLELVPMAWPQSVPDVAFCCLPPPVPIGELPLDQDSVQGLRPGTDRIDREAPESGRWGWLKGAAVASDPLTGIGPPGLQETRGAWTLAAPWDVLDSPGWQDTAASSDLGGTRNLMSVLLDSLLTREPQSCSPQPVLIQDQRPGDDPSLDGVSRFGPDNVLGQPNLNGPWDRPREVQQALRMNPPFASRDYAARDAVPAFQAYQEFLNHNPAWRDHFGSDLVVIQVIAASVYEPTVWLADPLEAACFDAWYEDYWIPAQTPLGDLPQREQPSPESGQRPEPLQPPLPEESWCGNGAGSDVSRTALLYQEFRRFLDQNPDWLTAKGGELGTGAITQSNHVPSIWLGGSQEALAFDAWYEWIRIPLPAQDHPVGPPSDGPLCPEPVPWPPSDASEPFISSEPLIASESALISGFRSISNPFQTDSAPPVDDSKTVFSDLIWMAPEQSEHRSARSSIDPMIAFVGLTSVEDGDDSAPTNPFALNPGPLRVPSPEAPDPLLAPRKVVDWPDWLPRHLRG